ncbi:hypothetical protein Ctob_003935 [Chrysochromulina tobinii]|uniref:Uncharacterized protein n=1 Tax=Chrysochromulina tobinii TaxID=1460289 RepID=A0A0M0J3J4_9EUKA|nr:hypothetical protein Ctob_003935 [Chrysochromulina tobinii]|eukprot:KOO20877.1 hypothetical protein Ctob_003935 [Chrysochromulina sp. CCMP291]
MKLKPSFFLHCITNRGLPFPSNIVDGQIQGHQPACDGHHSRHSVCSNWPDVIVPEVERRELGLLVALDGLADRAYALILEVVEGQIQGRQPAINAQGVSDCSDALCGVGALLVSGEVEARQPACDGHHGRHGLCSHWTHTDLAHVERRELGLLVALDGLTDCAYALIL